MTEAATSDEALDQLDPHAFDLILLEVKLPGVNGMKILEQLRETPSTSVIMMTALREEQQ